MPTAATRTDLEDYLGVTIPADQQDRVDRLLERAEGILAGEMPGLTFGPGSETVTLYGDGDDYLVLPKYPVSAVTACTIGGTTVDVDELSVDTLGRVRRFATGIVSPHGAEGGRYRWPDDGVAVVFTYDYGVASATPPDELAAVVVELAAARYSNPEQLTQESMGDRSRTYATGAGAGDNLTAGQLRRLRHWRRNRVASARVRA